MTMTSGLRKVVLTTHVVSSVGWLGAVASFLALAIMGIMSSSQGPADAAYVSMAVITWDAIVPLALVSLLTGVVASLGTAWGLFRHYWVLIKLLMTAFSTVVLIIHLQPIETLAATAATHTDGFGTLRGAQSMMVFASAAALAALVVMTGLSVYKPRGVTPIAGST